MEVNRYIFLFNFLRKKSFVSIVSYTTFATYFIKILGGHQICHSTLNFLYRQEKDVLGKKFRLHSLNYG